MNNSQKIFKVQDVINFEFEQRKRFVKILVITNLTDSVIEFNVKTNRLLKYNVRPAQGKIFKRDDHKITITRQPLQQHEIELLRKNQNASLNEKFKIQCQLEYRDQFERLATRVQQQTVTVKFSVKSGNAIGVSTNQLEQPKTLFIPPNTIQLDQQRKKKNEQLRILMQDVEKLQSEVVTTESKVKNTKTNKIIRAIEKTVEFSQVQIICLIVFILFFTLSFVD